MKNKLTSEEYESVKALVENALMAPNKREAEVYINSLKYYENKLSNYSLTIFRELVYCVVDASGRASVKESNTIDLLNKVKIFCTNN